MTEPHRTEPLHLAFDVGCSPEHAFATWTGRIDTWWPRDHTVGGDDVEEVVLQPRLGGRIFERTRGGDEHDWGQVTLWEPPVRFGYRWHLGQRPDDATDVEIHFEPTDSGTRVEISHRGWERLGDRGETLRGRNRAGWETLLPHYLTVV